MTKLVRARKQLCPACLDAGRLDLLGRPRRKDGASLCWSCEFCKGSGKSDAWPDYLYHPPMVNWFGERDRP